MLHVSLSLSGALVGVQRANPDCTKDLSVPQMPERNIQILGDGDSFSIAGSPVDVIAGQPGPPSV
jgi:hypothetical protein